jgi:hypothetical protein
LSLGEAACAFSDQATPAAGGAEPAGAEVAERADPGGGEFGAPVCAFVGTAEVEVPGFCCCCCCGCLEAAGGDDGFPAGDELDFEAVVLLEAAGAGGELFPSGGTPFLVGPPGGGCDRESGEVLALLVAAGCLDVSVRFVGGAGEVTCLFVVERGSGSPT